MKCLVGVIAGHSASLAMCLLPCRAVPIILWITIRVGHKNRLSTGIAPIFAGESGNFSGYTKKNDILTSYG